MHRLTMMVVLLALMLLVLSACSNDDSRPAGPYPTDGDTTSVYDTTSRGDGGTRHDRTYVEYLPDTGGVR